MDLLFFEWNTFHGCALQRFTAEIVSFEIIRRCFQACRSRGVNLARAYELYITQCKDIYPSDKKS